MKEKKPNQNKKLPLTKLHENKDFRSANSEDFWSAKL